MAPRAMYAPTLLASLVFLAACASSTSGLEGTPRMAEACQLRACSCVASGITIFGARERTEVLWRRNGEAFCPEDFELTFAD